MPSLYTARVASTGGRNGHVKSEDGLVDMDMTVPPSLGGNGDKPNPEVLFAAGYAACFGNAVIFVAKDKGIELAPEDPQPELAGIGREELNLGGCLH
ncbi:MAG: OsmC family protein, partial [Phycisphaerales bacterium]